MSNYFENVSIEFKSKLEQVKVYIKRHNPTIGILTEEILRDFLRQHLPKRVSVEQGFILNKQEILSKQCDIIIYDSHMYAPLYRINDIVVVPAESVISIIEVKTTINKSIFNSTINYFKSMTDVLWTNMHLFIFNSKKSSDIYNYFKTFPHEGDHKFWDHDTFTMLPYDITGINESYYMTKERWCYDGDDMGYSVSSYEGKDGSEINSLQLFFQQIYYEIEQYINKSTKIESKQEREQYYKKNFKSLQFYPLFGA